MTDFGPGWLESFTRIFVQQLGRGLRLSEGKEKVIVLDFVSDIRRMAEMIEMNNEGKAKGAEKEVVYLQISGGFLTMAKNGMPKEVRDKIFKVVYKKADEFRYMECDRVQSGQFMDLLVDDPEVGLILIEYMPKERVRTYIKDTILNRYFML